MAFIDLEPRKATVNVNIQDTDETVAGGVIKKADEIFQDIHEELAIGTGATRDAIIQLVAEHIARLRDDHSESDIRRVNLGVWNGLEHLGIGAGYVRIEPSAEVSVQDREDRVRRLDEIADAFIYAVARRIKGANPMLFANTTLPCMVELLTAASSRFPAQVIGFEDPIPQNLERFLTHFATVGYGNAERLLIQAPVVDLRKLIIRRDIISSLQPVYFPINTNPNDLYPDQQLPKDRSEVAFVRCIVNTGLTRVLSDLFQKRHGLTEPLPIR